MDFHDRLNFLADHFKQNQSKGGFLVDAIGALLDESKHNACHLLNGSPKYANDRFAAGKKISKQDALLIMNNANMLGSTEFFKERMPSSVDSQDKIAEAIGVEDNFADVNDLAGHIADFFYDTIKLCVEENDASASSVQSSINELTEKVQKAEEALEGIPRPTMLEVPEEQQPDERKYIDELYAAYTEDNSGQIVNQDNINDFDDYSDDLELSRMRYFSAESIRRSIQELRGRTFDNQFDVLKQEIYSAVSPVCKMAHRDPTKNGYDCELQVMNTAAGASVDSYLLSKSHYWISNNIKQGVCHFLVNDGRITWVKK